MFLSACSCKLNGRIYLIYINAFLALQLTLTYLTSKFRQKLQDRVYNKYFIMSETYAPPLNGKHYCHMAVNKQTLEYKSSTLVSHLCLSNKVE